MKSILFVCTGNSCRSVMAEGLFRKVVEHRAEEFEIASAGISAMDGFPASPETIEVMSGEGVDVSQHLSQRLKPDMVRAADKIYVMEKLHKDWILRLAPEAKSKTFLLGEFREPSHGMGDVEIPDPIRMSDSFYRNVLSVIRECVEKIAKGL
jgi:protein-tyrosine-phosphatase